MQLDKLLQSQGFGSRRYCQQLILAGHIKINGQVVSDIKQQIEPLNLEFSVFEEKHVYREKVYIALHKPKNYECSHQPQQHFSVFEFFPDYLLARNLQSIGRLDQDTTGLLLFTDDGQFLHALTHPKKQVSKYYVIETAQQITDEQIQKLAQGVTLYQEKGLFQAQNIKQLNNKQLRFAIDQGVYHQVKRMLHAVGNEVVALHRDQIGQLSLTQLSLAEGEWCYLNIEQIQQNQIK